MYKGNIPRKRAIEITKRNFFRIFLGKMLQDSRKKCNFAHRNKKERQDVTENCFEITN